MINKTKDKGQESDSHSKEKDINRFMKTLKSHLNQYYKEDYQIGSIYDGIDTIMYFPFTPKKLKAHKLKIAMVFNYQKKRFEIWLAGQNKQIQKKYWEIFRNSDWNKYHIPDSLSDGFSIVDDILVENPGFDDFESLMKQIETKSLQFIEDMLEVLK